MHLVVFDFETSRAWGAGIEDYTTRTLDATRSVIKLRKYKVWGALN